MNEQDVLRYGEYLTDEQIKCVSNDGSTFYVRIRVIDYNNELYYHKMVDGEVVEFKELI